MHTTSHRATRNEIAGKAAFLYANADAEWLRRYSFDRGETRPTAHGALAASTGAHTGRSPKDKFIVRDRTTEHTVWWDNAAAMSPEAFARLHADMLAAAAGREMFVEDLHAGADPAHRMAVSVFTPGAWHALFIRNLLIVPAPDGRDGFAADVTVLHLPDFKADPGRHGTHSETVIALDLAANFVLIAGTAYAGEIKKSVFSLFNFHAPARDVFPMHCSANVGPEGGTALFFGLSGTGKTTLSTDPERALIGDDEHGWTTSGVFNLEGGCYAKTAGLGADSEPEIFAATRRPGTVLENVVLDAAGVPDFDDLSLTENGRAAYPLETLDNVHPGGVGPAPRNVVLLTADAFGVLPPLARLTPDQAVYHFLSGYTAKVAGTERGITEPQATFSACFGAPFMSRRPEVYGEMLVRRLAASGATCWLLNTGWTGGAYGTGRRISIAATRRLLAAALSGELAIAPMRIDEVFGFEVPVAVDAVAPDLLDPRAGWPDPTAYDRQAGRLARLFADNIAGLGIVDPHVLGAGPRLREPARRTA